MKTLDSIWVTRDGRKIPVCDLKVDHLRNLIPFMEGWHGRVESEVFSSACFLQGEMALESVDNLLDSIQMDCPCEACEWKLVFQLELLRRGFEI